MASCDVVSSSKKSNCDYCAEKSKTNAACGFCPQCRKYLCSTCETFHGLIFDHEVIKFLEKKTAKRDAMACETSSILFTFCRLETSKRFIWPTVHEKVLAQAAFHID